MASNFAAYLASLGTTLTPFTPLPDSSSPTKRARSDSPDSPLSSPDHHPSYFSHPPLRSILSSPHPSSPHSSPPLSRSLSRRSSTSHKSVRFARCTNASVFPAHSGDEYDRTSIVTTCEAESLQLPAREEAEGWIKCVERERKAREEGKRCMPRVVEKPVEGVHGLIEGGYFVGEERDEVEDDEEEGDDDAMVVDDEEENADGEEETAEVEAEEPTPALVRDDSSGDDSDGVMSVSSDVALPLPSSSPRASPSLGFGFMERTVTVSVEELEEEEREEKRKTKCRERYGLCALGKYSRAEVFQSYDSLGGF